MRTVGFKYLDGLISFDPQIWSHFYYCSNPKKLWRFARMGLWFAKLCFIVFAADPFVDVMTWKMISIGSKPGITSMLENRSQFVVNRQSISNILNCKDLNFYKFLAKISNYSSFYVKNTMKQNKRKGWACDKLKDLIMGLEKKMLKNYNGFRSWISIFQKSNAPCECFFPLEKLRM